MINYTNPTESNIHYKYISHNINQFRTNYLIFSIIVVQIFSPHLLFAQNQNMFQKGQFQITVAFNWRPVKKANSQVNFRYIDGSPTANYSADTITANNRLNQNNFANTISLGVGYFVTDKIRTSFTLQPYLNSFLSNKNKNGNVYGVQFDFGLDYFTSLSRDLSFSFGTTASRIIGGFGITSGGAKNKNFLVVNGNEIHDNDIGFHIIDKCWALGPKIGFHYRASNNIVLSANSGFQFSFGRESKMNFAGTLKHGSVKWNSKSYNDPDVNLTINDTKITNENIKKLPYNFSGLFFDLGLIFDLNK